MKTLAILRACAIFLSEESRADVKDGMGYDSQTTVPNSQFRIVCRASLIALLLVAGLPLAAQQSLTWEQVKAKFEATNSVLKADAAKVEEMKAEEITAFLRPNPQVSLNIDGTQIVPHDGVWTPLRGTYEQPSFSYLHEREHKRELRLESAKEGTQIIQSQHVDLERNLIFGLRSAFVQTLQAMTVLELARADLECYYKIIDISQARFNAGDIAKVDLARIELQRVQYESEIETANVNLQQQKNSTPDSARRPHTRRSIRRDRSLRPGTASTAARRVSPDRARQQAGPAGGDSDDSAIANQSQTCRRQWHQFFSGERGAEALFAGRLEHSGTERNLRMKLGAGHALLQNFRAAQWRIVFGLELFGQK
jgi:hypothetical protein